jgi:hypothetical protein
MVRHSLTSLATAAGCAVRNRAWIALRRALVLTFGVGALAAPAHAQVSGDGFLFHAPRIGFTLRGGYDGATANSDVFAFATDQLTLRRSAFRGPFAGLDVAFPVMPRLDITLSSSYTETSRKSQFRHWVDLNDLPIEQTTSLRRVPVTLGVRGYLMPRGRSVGQFAWIPARISPYVGAAGGFMWYRFRQHGDFIDFQTTNVFPDDFRSSGAAPVAQASVGLDYSLTPHLVLNAEGKYNWAKGNLGSDFSGFGRIDLSGYMTTLGLSVRF